MAPKKKTPAKRKPARAVKQVKPAVKKAAPKAPRKSVADNSENIPAAAPSREFPAEFYALPMKQQVFIQKYLSNGFNATNAAKDAGFAAKSADSQASRLLKNDKVRAIMRTLTQNSLARLEISREATLAEVNRVARFDVRRLYGPGGELLPIDLLDDDTAAGVAGLKFKDGLLSEIKHADKVPALGLLMRHFGLLAPTQHTVKIERVVVREALKKERKLPPAKPSFE